MADKQKWITYGVIAALVISILAITGTKIGSAPNDEICTKLITKDKLLIESLALKDAAHSGITTTATTKTWSKSGLTVIEDSAARKTTLYADGDELCSIEMAAPPGIYATFSSTTFNTNPITMTIENTFTTQQTFNIDLCWPDTQPQNCGAQVLLSMSGGNYCVDAWGSKQCSMPAETTDIITLTPTGEGSAGESTWARVNGVFYQLTKQP